jgi:phage-related minor tail protein
MSNVSQTIEGMLPKILAAMANAAKSQWKKVADAVTSELKIFVHRMAQISEGVIAGQLSKADAQSFYGMAKNNFISLVAMSTVLVWTSAQKVINAGLSVIQQSVNALVGFELL